jgi:RNA polymerase sigma factor (sigma-70 family)
MARADKIFMVLEEKKLSEIYDRLSRELYVYILRLVRSRETAEDILHDCFVNLINYSKKYDIIESTVKPFLYRAAHNLCVNYIKRSDTVKITASDDIEHADNVNFTDALELDELNDAIYKLISNLDEKIKSVFIMKKDMNMSNEEIAQNLGISERTVRRHVKSAILYLSGELIKSGLIEKLTLLMAIFLG